MPFIGKQPETGAFKLIDSITTSATATYALTVNSAAYFPESARNLIVSLNGVTQAPESAYTVSGSNIVFASALTASDVIDYILVIGDAVDIGTPSDNTVGTDQIASSVDLSGKTLTFANDQISGNVIDGGTISNFASTGIDDNATSTAITIDSSQNVTVGGNFSATKLTALNGTLELDDNGTHNGIINVPATLLINIDSDNNNTGESFRIAKDRTGTSGGTELFRVEENGNVGIGTASPSTSLDVVRAGVMPLRVQSTSGTECQINMVNTGGNVQLEAHSGNFTIDADNVGIGTTSPGQKLDVDGTIQSSVGLRVAGHPVVGYSSITGGYSTNLGSTGTSTLNETHIYSGGNFRAAFTASGLLVGKTSSSLTTAGNEANAGTFAATASSTSTNLSTSNGGVLNLCNSSATDGNFSNIGGYNSNGLVTSQIDFVNVSHSSRTGAIAFLTHNGSSMPERMRINSSGNVGIGTTSPTNPLTVQANSGAGAAALNGRSSDGIATLGFYASNGTTAQGYVQGRSDSLRVWAASGDYLSFGSSDTERMRINTDGSIAMSPNSGVSGNAAISINASGSSYAEIDAFNWGIGWDMPLVLQRQAGEVWIGGTTDRGSYKLQVNGTGVWGQGSYVNGSDVRWKDNVQTLDCNCLDIVNNLRSVSYTYNEDSGASDLATPHLGFIAQEVEQATGDHPWLSGLVTEDPQGYKSMAYQELIPVLTKAIQEQQVMIETLKAEVAALKGA